MGMKKSLLILSAVVMVGCASYDWSSEVGTYTLDQALLEFGPPDATSKLGNGNTIASWSELGGYSVRKRILQFDKDGKLVTGKSTLNGRTSWER